MALEGSSGSPPRTEPPGQASQRSAPPNLRLSQGQQEAAQSPSADGPPPRGARCPWCHGDHDHRGLRCRNYAYNLVVRVDAIQRYYHGGLDAFATIYRLSVCDANRRVALYRSKTLRALWTTVEELLAAGLQPWRDFITWGGGPIPLDAYRWSAHLRRPVLLGFPVEWLKAVVSAEDLGGITLYHAADALGAEDPLLGTIQDTTSAYLPQ